MFAVWLLIGLVVGLALGFLVGRETAEDPEPIQLPVVREDGPEDLAWTARMSPERYLHRLPDGPLAERARRIVGEKGGKVPASDPETPSS